MKWARMCKRVVKRFAFFALSILLVSALTACGITSENSVKVQPEQPAPTETVAGTEQAEAVKEQAAAEIIQEEQIEETEEASEAEQAENKINLQISDYHFTATLEENEAASELLEMLVTGPLVLTLDDYSGFEKVGPLGKSLSRDDKQTTTQSGDIVLYSGSNIVIFYGSNSWSYTRLGRIDDLTDWGKALGSGSVTVIFSKGS